MATVSVLDLLFCTTNQHDTEQAKTPAQYRHDMRSSSHSYAYSPRPLPSATVTPNSDILR